MRQRGRVTDRVKHFDEPYISESAGEPRSIADATEDFRKDLLGLIPFLRAFSRSLCGDRELADDLAQEALAKAWQSRDTFRAGSNLKAWLFTILRNQFYSDRRRAWRQAPWGGTPAERGTVPRGRTRWGVPASRTPPAPRGRRADKGERRC